MTKFQRTKLMDAYTQMVISAPSFFKNLYEGKVEVEEQTLKTLIFTETMLYQQNNLSNNEVDAIYKWIVDIVNRRKKAEK